MLSPDGQEDRLAALHRYQILDSDREEEFDKLVELVREVFDVPIAAISFVDGHRQWFKAESGINRSETPLDCSICAHAIQTGQPSLIVPDTLLDDRTICNPLVSGQPNIRFYAGGVIRTADGHALGALLVLDTQPRTLTTAQEKLLQTLANQVMLMLESRRISEGRLSLSERLKSNLDLRRDVLSVVSHDLRSPLSAISLVAHLSGEWAHQFEGGQRLSDLSSILRSSTEDMQRLVSDLSDYSSIDQGQMRMKFETGSLRALVENLDVRFRILAENAGIRFCIHQEEGLPAEISADPYRLVQAVGNLVGNALAFTPEDGAIGIHLSRSGSDGLLAIQVSNTGRGISPGIIHKIFDRFWTESGSANKGRGLGLWIARSIAQAHGGDISVASEEDAVTTFTLTISPGI